MNAEMHGAPGWSIYRIRSYNGGYCIQNLKSYIGIQRKKLALPSFSEIILLKKYLIFFSRNKNFSQILFQLN